MNNGVVWTLTIVNILMNPNIENPWRDNIEFVDVETKAEDMTVKMHLPENSITLNTGETEMLRVARDGFYVRGKKLETDDKESENVYNCFKQWLEWSMLNRE